MQAATTIQATQQVLHWRVHLAYLPTSLRVQMISSLWGLHMNLRSKLAMRQPQRSVEIFCVIQSRSFLQLITAPEATISKPHRSIVSMDILLLRKCKLLAYAN